LRIGVPPPVFCQTVYDRNADVFQGNQQQYQTIDAQSAKL
jgi:hypothetical protein